MAWKTLSLYFRQTYEGGYRYLDKCGEFMLEATEKMDFIAGEAKPTGAKLEIPDQGINLAVDANALILSQEIPSDDDTYFVGICRGTTGLASACFRPKSIIKNGFALKAYWQFSNVQDLFAASLKLGDKYHNEIAKTVGMPPDYKKLDFTFSSGSKEFHVVVQPITFDNTRLVKQNISSQANKIERNKIERRNVFADRLSDKFTASHALILELDLMESDPPADASLENHFAELKQKFEQLKKTFVP